MASIRERKGKFNVIYNYKDDSGKRKQKWETWSDEETDVLSLEQSCVGFSFEEAQEQTEKEASQAKTEYPCLIRIENIGEVW